MATFTSPYSYLRQSVVRTALTLDLAGSGGSSLPDLTPITVSILDQDGNFLRTTSALASIGAGATSDACSVFLNSMVPIFPTYDGSKDSIEIVLSSVGSLNWTQNGVGPRIMRFDSTFAQNQQVGGYSGGGNRQVYAVTTGGSTASVNSGPTYDVRSIGGHFTRGTVTGGWTDAVPTAGAQITLNQTVSRRMSSTVATQTDAALLNMGTGDKYSFGLVNIAGALASRSFSQSASGVTLTHGTSSMLFRYVHLFHIKGN